MHYLLLVYMDETRWAELPDAEKARLHDECDVYGQELVTSGHFLGGAPLQPSKTAATIRHASNGKPIVTDGPFAETKEVLAGYHLVDCRDRDEAIALGQRFPGLRRGLTIEVRPLLAR